MQNNPLYITELESLDFKNGFGLFSITKVRKQVEIKLNPGYGNMSKE